MLKAYPEAVKSALTILKSTRSRRAPSTTFLLGLIAVVLASVTRLNAAAPRLILISGPLVARPVLIDDWNDTSRIMAGINDRAVAQSDALVDRPFYDLALFWGLEWVQYITDGRPLAALTPGQANQHARFYPAVGTAPALVVFRDEPGAMGGAARRMGLIRSVEQMTLDVFARYGLRVRMESQARP
jgi:hypothetical protein